MGQAAEQRHPQEHRDRLVVAQIRQEGRTDYNLVELARLRIRYRNFPGAIQLQTELDQIMASWELDEENLFALTREIHAQRAIYRRSRDGTEEQDWS
jgi:hypothetical protein